MSKESYAVIGMGRFGAGVAEALFKMGYEVMILDEDPERVHQHNDIATYAVEADSTDEKNLKNLGLRNFDVVVVAIGADIQASILTTLILKELGVKKIVVKAQNERHGSVLKKLGADKVVFPERDMGIRVANQLVSPNILDFVELSDEYSVEKITVPEDMYGKTISELNIRVRFGVNVIAIESDGKFNIAPGAKDVLKEGDLLVVIGHIRDLKKFEEHSSRVRTR